MISLVVDDLTRNSLYRVADAAVFPVCMNSGSWRWRMAAGTQWWSVIGGFAGIIQHGHNGLTTYTGSSQSPATILWLSWMRHLPKLHQAYADVIAIPIDRIAPS